MHPYIIINDDIHHNVHHIYLKNMPIFIIIDDIYHVHYHH